MKRNAIIQKTILMLSALPENKLIEVLDFVDYLVRKQKQLELIEGIQKLSEESKVFKFLNDDENLYTVTDVKEEY